MYASNGAAVAFSLRSKAARDRVSRGPLRDGARHPVFGYFTGYSDIIRRSRGDLTFAVLKAHTNNRGGRVHFPRRIRAIRHKSTSAVSRRGRT